ncbi:MAG: hypothetical protein WB681_05605 [Candidatus Cybelea sp.]
MSGSGSIDAGLRRIIGRNLPNSFQPFAHEDDKVCIQAPYAPGRLVNAGNVSVALHFLSAKNEYYIVYGDANALSTLSAYTSNGSRYIGAEKGV